MDPQSHSSSLSCELRIVKAKNIDMKSGGAVFVRCYLSAGNSTRVRLDSQEISSKSELITWDQTFSLDCLGSQESIRWLKQGTLVFELRWRSTAAPFIGRIQGSKLIGRAEVPWRNVVDSTNMEMEKWVVMIPQNGRVHEDFKPPAVQITMKIQESDPKIIERKKIDEGRWDEWCGCLDGGCNSCVDYELYAIGAALEAL
ncbi:hypothetical protein Pfo_007812 [Paulownia fortunei]|nr:hypothetical protein Pfo_007812 [Paulownia fortunei]